MLHVTCTQGTFELATTPSALGAGRGRASTKLAWIILRGRICACVLAIDRFCDNAEGFARMCLIYTVQTKEEDALIDTNQEAIS